MHTRILMLVLCIALLSACVSTNPAIREPHAYAGAPRPPGDAATLVAAIDQPPLVAVFHTIDSMRVTSGGAGAAKVYVLAGTHKVIVFGHTGKAVLYPTEIVSEFSAGHTYKLRYRVVVDERSKESAQLWFEDLGNR